MVNTQPIWGYKIKKQAEKDFNIKLRHGALYPALNALEREKAFLQAKNNKKMDAPAKSTQ